jgi:hypothetical protein
MVKPLERQPWLLCDMKIEKVNSESTGWQRHQLEVLVQSTAAAIFARVIEDHIIFGYIVE